MALAVASGTGVEDVETHSFGFQLAISNLYSTNVLCQSEIKLYSFLDVALQNPRLERIWTYWHQLSHVSPTKDFSHIYIYIIYNHVL